MITFHLKGNWSSFFKNSCILLIEDYLGHIAILMTALYRFSSFVCIRDFLFTFLIIGQNPYIIKNYSDYSIN